MKIHTLALSVATLTYPAVAAPPPPKWYVLNGAAGECQIAVEQARRIGIPSIASPGLFEANAKTTGNYAGTHIYRNDDGSIFSVEVITANNGLAMAYFPKLVNCQAALLNGIMRGNLHGPGEIN